MNYCIGLWLIGSGMASFIVSLGVDLETKDKIELIVLFEIFLSSIIFGAYFIAG